MRAISKECISCVVALMRRFEFEMSLMTCMDNTGRFNVSLHNDHPQVTDSVIIDIFYNLESQFTNSSLPRFKTSGILKAEHKKLACKVEETRIFARDEGEVELESISKTGIAEISRSIGNSESSLQIQIFYY